MNIYICIKQLMIYNYNCSRSQICIKTKKWKKKTQSLLTNDFCKELKKKKIKPNVNLNFFLQSVKTLQNDKVQNLL